MEIIQKMRVEMDLLKNEQFSQQALELENLLENEPNSRIHKSYKTLHKSYKDLQKKLLQKINETDDMKKKLQEEIKRL